MFGELVADVPCKDFLYWEEVHRCIKENGRNLNIIKKWKKFKIDQIAIPNDLIYVSKYLVSNENIASKKMDF